MITEADRARWTDDDRARRAAAGKDPDHVTDPGTLGVIAAVLDPDPEADR